MVVSQQISKFIYNTNYEDLPGEVIDKAKQCLLDSIGVALYGSQFEASQISSALIKEAGGREEASILGANQKAPCFQAALANGIRAHIADYDDSLVDFHGHPSCILMPVTLALAEMKGRSGQELLTAFILGTEVASKLGWVIDRDHFNIAFHSTPIMGTLAAAAAAAKLLQLPLSQIINALGIAASSASGLRQNFGTMTKSWHVGHAASMGMMGALLAQKGYDASAQVLEGETGFVQAFRGSKKVFPIEQLGNPYSLTKIQFKKYPSCACTHPSVDAILKLRGEHRFHTEEVKTVECHVCPRVSLILTYKNPQNALQAKFSLEYCVAAALVSGRLGIAQLTDEAVFKPEVRELMEKVSVNFEPRLEELAKKKSLINPSYVAVTLVDGRQFSQTVEEAKGGPHDPLKWSELAEKFLECSRQLLRVEQAQEIIRLIQCLEQVGNVADLVRWIK